MTKNMRFAPFLILYLLRTYVSGINEIPNSLLEEMRSVGSTKEFYEKFVDGGYKTFQVEKIGLSGGTSLTGEETTGFCQPMETSVKVPSASNPTWFTHPECIKVKRCNGCCGSNTVSCQPVERNKTFHRVSRFKYDRESRKLKLERDDIHEFEQHTKCKCQCSIKASDCTEGQVYERNQCECSCRNSGQARDCEAVDKTWDPKKCECVCKDIKQCFNGYFFNPITCRCQYAGGVS